MTITSSHTGLIRLNSCHAYFHIINKLCVVDVVPVFVNNSQPTFCCGFDRGVQHLTLLTLPLFLQCRHRLAQKTFIAPSMLSTAKRLKLRMYKRSLVCGMCNKSQTIHQLPSYTHHRVYIFIYIHAHTNKEERLAFV